MMSLTSISFLLIFLHSLSKLWKYFFLHSTVISSFSMILSSSLNIQKFNFFIHLSLMSCLICSWFLISMTWSWTTVILSMSLQQLFNWILRIIMRIESITQKSFLMSRISYLQIHHLSSIWISVSMIKLENWSKFLLIDYIFLKAVTMIFVQWNQICLCSILSISIWKTWCSYHVLTCFSVLTELVM